jgi:hypothetical protein
MYHALSKRQSKHLNQRSQDPADLIAYQTTGFRAKDSEPHNPSHTPRSMEIVILKEASLILRYGSWAFLREVWEIYEIILSSYFLPLLRRASTPCTTRRSSEGKEIILIGGDSLVVALGP